MTKYEMVGWHHQLDGHKFEQALGVDDGQGSLVPIFPSGCEGKLGVALESLQGRKTSPRLVSRT